MKKLKPFALGLILCIAWAPAIFAQAKSSEEPVLVGRITFVEDQLLRYVHAEQDWVATVKDAPFGLEDALYANDTGKAEFKLPNSTWVRIGADTQLQLIALKEDATEIDVAAGTARFYNKSSNAVIKATTPFGYVVSQPGTAFDLYVGDESVEIICLDGSIDFIIEGNDSKYVIEAGGSSIICDGKQAVEGDGTVDADWDEWNLQREELWTQRVQVKGESVGYLPPELQDDAYDLDQHGRWERVYYEGEYRDMWRPTVEAEWQPFTAGRWTEWNEDNVWIPEEEYGYVTHHYGNWVRVDSCGCWYWAPPVRVRVGYTGRCACWYPGRVAWIHSGVDIGWVPLAPTEIYYGHRYWGPGAVFVGGAGFAGVGVNIGGLAYLNHAVVVNQANFFTVNNYRNVRIVNINRTTIINNYRVAHVLNDRVIRGYGHNRGRFLYNTRYANLHAKPHRAVLKRINQNRTLARQQRRVVSARAIDQRVKRARLAEPKRGPQWSGKIRKPQVSGKIVPANKANLPRNKVSFQQRALKSREKAPQGVRRGAPGDRRGGAEKQPGIKSPRGPRTQDQRRVVPDRPSRRGEPGVRGPRQPRSPREGVRRGETTGTRGSQRGRGQEETLQRKGRAGQGPRVGSERRQPSETRRLQREQRQRRPEQQQRIRKQRTPSQQGQGQQRIRKQQTPRQQDQQQRIRKQQTPKQQQRMQRQEQSRSRQPRNLQQRQGRQSNAQSRRGGSDAGRSQMQSRPRGANRSGGQQVQRSRPQHQKQQNRQQQKRKGKARDQE